MSTATNRLLSMCALLLCSAPLKAIDIFQFYRAPFFQGTPRSDQRDSTSYLDFRYGHGKTDTAWDRDGNRVGVLSQYGQTDVSLLASNVAEITQCSHPVTYDWLNPCTGKIPGYNFTGCDGKIALSGTFDIEEFNFIYQQNLRFGFYFMAYLPYRDIKVYDIHLENFTHPENERADDFTEFLCSGTFDQVLCENGFDPACTSFIKSGSADGAFYIGWHGYDDHTIDLFHDVAGFVQLGAIVPFSGQRNQRILSAVPLGYDDHWAASTRFGVEVGLADHFAVGFNGAVDIIWAQERCETIKTDLCQDGLIYFGRDSIDLKQGLLWHGGLYFHFDQPFKGLHFTSGYSYSKKDRTRLESIECDDLPVNSARSR